MRLHFKDDREDKRMLFESLFYEGYEYQEIVQILRTQHGIELSLSILKRKDNNLSRNNAEFCCTICMPNLIQAWTYIPSEATSVLLFL